MKIEKRIVIYPYGAFKSVTLGVSDVIDFEDADRLIAEEINLKYIELLPKEDLEILMRTNKYIKRNEKNE